MKYIFEEIDISTPIMPDVVCIKRTDEQGNVAWIPNVRGNSDYEHYLRWLNGEPELEPIVRDPAPVEALLIQEVTTND